MGKPTENTMERSLVSTNPMLSSKLLSQEHMLPLRYSQLIENWKMVFKSSLNGWLQWKPIVLDKGNELPERTRSS